MRRPAIVLALAALGCTGTLLAALGCTGTLLAASGCTGTPTQVMLHVDAQPGGRASAATLRVRVIGSDGAARLDEERAIDGTTAWPLRVPLVPEGGDASRTWAVEAILEDEAGATVSIARARGGYAAGELREALLCLHDGCASEPCGSLDDGCSAGGVCRTCRGGACSDATASLDARGSAPRCPSATCAPRGPREDACGDGADDDCDGRVDCADSDCDCDGGACTATRTEDTVEACHDGSDDDCDGLVDCDEGGVCVFTEGPDGCANGLDDDCDGLVDCLDPACCAAPECDQDPCGANGRRCCAGACVDTWSSEQHCGACNLGCASGRACVRVPSGSGGSAPGAACRCAVGAGECAPGLTCEDHDGVELCNCPSDFRCLGRAVCRMQGAAHHAYCAIP